MNSIDLHHTVGRPIDLLGAGIDNLAVLPHLDGALELAVWVDDPGTVSAEARATCVRFGATVGAIEDWVDRTAQPNRLVLRSPGFPRYRADIARALENAPPGSVSTAIDLWFATFGDRYPTVIVTGTKGKSTVARMLATLIPDSELVGNIGTPIWSVPLPKPGTVIVCEVSSYQAVDFRHRADLGVLTSLSEDHVSWHGSVERYQADKLGSIRDAHRILTTADLSSLFEKSVDTIDPAVAPDPFTHLAPHMAANAQLAVEAAQILMTAFDVSVVPDPHQALVDLPAMVGRLRELSSSRDDHRWFDDSLASNPSGSAAAVTAFGSNDLWLILGGIDRNVSVEPLVQSLRACTGSISVIAVPDNGDDLIDQLIQAGIAIDQRLTSDNVSQAVAMVRTSASSPATVLFSPAAPTPPQHGNWADRSAAFEAAVLEGSS